MLAEKQTSRPVAGHPHKRGCTPSRSLSQTCPSGTVALPLDLVSVPRLSTALQRQEYPRGWPKAKKGKYRETRIPLEWTVFVRRNLSGSVCRLGGLRRPWVVNGPIMDRTPGNFSTPVRSDCCLPHGPACQVSGITTMITNANSFVNMVLSMIRRVWLELVGDGRESGKVGSQNNY